MNTPTSPSTSLMSKHKLLKILKNILAIIFWIFSRNQCGRLYSSLSDFSSAIQWYVMTTPPRSPLAPPSTTSPTATTPYPILNKVIVDDEFDQDNNTSNRSIKRTSKLLY